MEQKYKEKLELCKKLLHLSQTIGPSEEAEKMFDDGYALMRELIQTKDTEILCELLDLFTDEMDDTGVCETLMSQIGVHYTSDQKFEALCKKFDTFVENNLTRCCIMISWFFYEEYFPQFREVFNKVKSQYSEKFLDEMQRYWIPDGADTYVSILREDIQKW